MPSRTANLYLHRKAVLINALGGECDKCGEDRLACLTLHHPEGVERGRPNNGTTTHRSESLWRRPLDDATWAEAGQCQILCANCHSLEHSHDNQHQTAAQYLSNQDA